MDQWRGVTVGRLIDYLTEHRWLSALLVVVIDELNTSRAAAVFIEQLHARSEGVLRSLGCFRVGAPTRFMLKVRDRASPLAGALSHTARWFITRADSDSDFGEEIVASP